MFFCFIASLVLSACFVKKHSAVVEIEASVTNGVAPLFVSFEVPHDSEEFHTYSYNWNFNDNPASSWASNGLSKNQARGALAAHVFENPGTYLVSVNVKTASGELAQGSKEIVVSDPNLVYAGEATTCVNPLGDEDFSAAPSGARKIQTNDISSITAYANPGSRILLKRGASWSTAGISDWPEHGGPVSIGAYGPAADPDAFGIYANAPQINMSAGTFLDIGRKSDWRVMDISFSNPGKNANVIGGVYLAQRILMLHLSTRGFGTAIGWSHWLDPSGPQLDQLALVSCDIRDAGEHCLYAGSERLALLGNNFQGADDSHTARVWQAYKSVISSNSFSGSSLTTNSGRQALKLHGPGAEELGSTAWDHLNRRSEFVIVSDNIFGSSGPWPVSLGPQDDGKDERLSDIVFERNRYCADYGARSALSLALDTAFLFYGRRISIRNNVVDGANFGRYFTGITIRAGSASPNPEDIWIYNNTIYKPNDPDGQDWIGIFISSGASKVQARNNLISFPVTSSGSQTIIVDNGSATIKSNNILNGNFSFADPDNASQPIKRSFALKTGSSAAIDKGYASERVFEDFSGTARPLGSGSDIGALESW